MKKQIIRASASTTDPKLQDLKQRIRDLSQYMSNLEDELSGEPEWDTVVDVHEHIIQALGVLARERRN